MFPLRCTMVMVYIHVIILLWSLITYLVWFKHNICPQVVFAVVLAVLVRQWHTGIESLH